MKHALSSVTRGGCHGLWQTYYLIGSASTRTPVTMLHGSVGFRTHLSGRAPRTGA
jgi:hypothetical protein